MKPENFFEKFDRFADAPGAVAKMRQLIVDLAVAGTLVENSPEDPPVDLPELDLDETHPTNWRLGNLGKVLAFEYGKNLPAKKRSESGEYPVYGSNGVVGTHDSYVTKEPAIILGRKGSAGALNISEGPSWTTDVAYYIVPPDSVDLRFAFYLLTSLRLNELGKGIKPGLSRKEAYALSVGLPPLAEQKRIVAKVDELMALCDRLEAQQRERDTRHAALARASLARFADAPTPADLQFLFHKSYDIDPADLRKTILTLAVQGNLVPQSRNDDPASMNGRDTDSKGSPPPFALPEKWLWASLVEVSSEIVDCPHSTPKWTDSGKYCVRTSQLNPGFLDLSSSKFVSEKTFEERIKRLTPMENDILYCREGQVGNACRVPPGIELCLGQRMMLIRSSSQMDPSMLELILNSPLIAARVATLITGMTAPRVNVKMVKDYWIPVPPLKEQRRIVAKVNELMALVDELETQLSAYRATAKNLLEALIAELTAAGASSLEVPA